MKQFIFGVLITIISVAIVTAQDNEKHVFILSGQSNMKRLKPEADFIPRVEKEFGVENVIVIKDAQGGQPIRRWDKQADLLEGDKNMVAGDLYDRLLSKVKPEIQGVKMKSVTFVWMQGERDAKDLQSKKYKDSFKRLLKQLDADLNLKQSTNFVIGRLSDFGVNSKMHKEWNEIRKIQVQLAQESEYGAWVDCDDLNDGEAKGGKNISNGLHYSVKGYKLLGLRFAEKSIQLIGENNK